IVYQYSSRTYGTATIIEHPQSDGTYIYTLYAHQQDYVEKLTPDRQTIGVQAGQLIGHMGNTGFTLRNGQWVQFDVHLHFDQWLPSGRLDFRNGFPLPGGVQAGELGDANKGITFQRVGPTFWLPDGRVMTSDNGQILYNVPVRFLFNNPFDPHGPSEIYPPTP